LKKEKNGTTTKKRQRWQIKNLYDKVNEIKYNKNKIKIKINKTLKKK
jgi:hypothetical protein